MKSAYELAMERLEKNQPSVKLTEAKKKEIAEIDALYTAKIAEKKVFLNGQIAEAANEPSEVSALEKQLAMEIARLNEECEDKKNAVRNKNL